MKHPKVLGVNAPKRVIREISRSNREFSSNILLKKWGKWGKTFASKKNNQNAGMNVPSYCRISLDDMYKPEIKVYYIQGESKDKTQWALKKIEDLGYSRNYDRVYHKKKGTWHGVTNHRSKEVALYENFNETDMSVTDFVSFIDCYVNPMNVAHSYSMNVYKHIFITSSVTFDNLYPYVDKSDRKRIESRRNYINIIDL